MKSLICLLAFAAFFCLSSVTLYAQQNAWPTFNTSIEVPVSGAVQDYPVTQSSGELQGTSAIRFVYSVYRLPGHQNIEGWHYQTLNPSIPVAAQVLKRGEQLFGLVTESNCPSGQARREYRLLMVLGGQEIPVGETQSCSNGYVNGQLQYPAANFHTIIKIDGSPYSLTQAALVAEGLKTGTLYLGSPL